MEKGMSTYTNDATYGAALYLRNEYEAYAEILKMWAVDKLNAQALSDLFKRLKLVLDEWMAGEVDWEAIAQEYISEFLKEGIPQQPQPDLPTDVLSVLSQCLCEGNMVKLPCQLPRDLYNKVATILKDLGGPWNRKHQAHVFKEDPAGMIDNIIVTGKIKRPEKFGFFPTPKALAELIVQHAKITQGMTVLEPSAGSANLADEIVKYTERGNLLCCELQEKNVSILKDKGYQVERGDFLSIQIGTLFDRVVMNPPFERQADITHVLYAWKFLKPGGRLVAIMSSSVLFRQDRKANEFRDFVDKFGGDITENPAGSFKSSGTAVNTITLVMDKPVMVTLTQPKVELDTHYDVGLATARAAELFVQQPLF